jgi:hypothetical protein
MAAIDDSDTSTVGPADPAHPASAIFTDVLDAALDAVKEHMDLLAGGHVAVMLDRHPELEVVNIAMTATMERGRSPFLTYTADATGVVLPALRI